MADQVDLASRPRAGSGKSEARALRREGRVPAIAYGVGLTFDGQTHLALARQVTRHPVRREILHVDFVTVSRDVRVSVEVPIVLEGEAAGVQEGGVLEQAHFAMNIEVLPLEVPGSLPVDVTGLGIGDVLRVSDVPLPDGVDLLDDPEQVVASVVMPQLDVPETETAEEREADEFEAEGKTADEADAAAEALERE
jgi:large subunit ribosomal protein L25